MRAGRIEIDDSQAPARVLELVGEHDLSTAEELREAFRSANGSDRPVVVDLSATDFIDSSIVAAIVECAKPNDSGTPRVILFVPVDASASVRRVIELTGMDSHMTVRDTLDAALRDAAGGD